MQSVIRVGQSSYGVSISDTCWSRWKSLAESHGVWNRDAHAVDIGVIVVVLINSMKSRYAEELIIGRLTDSEVLVH